MAERERRVRGLQWRCSHYDLCIHMCVCVCVRVCLESACVLCVSLRVCVCWCVESGKERTKGAKGEGHNALGEGDEIGGLRC